MGRKNTPSPDPTIAAYLRASSDGETRHATRIVTKHIEQFRPWTDDGELAENVADALNNGRTYIKPHNDDDAIMYVVDREDRDDDADPEGILRHVVENDPVRHVVVPTVAHMPGLDVVRDVVENGSWLHAAATGLSLQPGCDPTSSPISNATQLSKRTPGADERAEKLLRGIPHNGGRPPLGTTSEGGVLQPDDNYHDVCRTLQRYIDGEISKRRAADRLDCAPQTIEAAADRPAMYQLDV